MKGRRSTPGRYFRVAEPGTAWGGTNIDDPLSILEPFNPKIAWPKLRLLMVSTTGEHRAYFELDEALRPVEQDLPNVLSESVARIKENCEPALSTVLFMGAPEGLSAQVSRKTPSASPTPFATPSPASPAAAHPSTFGRVAASPSWST